MFPSPAVWEALVPITAMRNVPLVMPPGRESRFDPENRAPFTSFTSGENNADSLTSIVHGLLLGAVYVRIACVAVVPTKVIEDGCAIAGVNPLAKARRQITAGLRTTEQNRVLKREMTDRILKSTFQESYRCASAKY
jgi:hypothetical protein